MQLLIIFSNQYTINLIIRCQTKKANIQIQSIAEIVPPSKSTKRAALFDLSKINEEAKPIRLLPFQPESSRWRISMPEYGLPMKEGLFSKKQFKCPTGD